jgi:hypothetical protein
METTKYYKGFDKKMKCRGFQYEEGETYEEDEAVLCDKGFHACEAPLDCFRYYPPADSLYHEVELSDIGDKKDDDSKRVGKKIKIGGRLDIRGLVAAQIEYVKSRTAFENTDTNAATAGYRGTATAGNRGAATAGYRGAATAGEYGAATAGDCGTATAGYRGAATAGDCGAATAGEYGAATAGYRGTATAGYRGAATAGDCGAATAGDCGAATAGNSGAATSFESSKVGENGLAVARGNNVRVMGGIGAIIVIAEENEKDHGIKNWKAALVDGKKIKADTWYVLENGEFLEETKSKSDENRNNNEQKN